MNPPNNNNLANTLVQSIILNNPLQNPFTPGSFFNGLFELCAKPQDCPQLTYSENSVLYSTQGFRYPSMSLPGPNTTSWENTIVTTYIKEITHITNDNQYRIDLDATSHVQWELSTTNQPKAPLSADFLQVLRRSLDKHQLFNLANDIRLHAQSLALTQCIVKCAKWLALNHQQQTLHLSTITPQCRHTRKNLIKQLNPLDLDYRIVLSPSFSSGLPPLPYPLGSALSERLVFRTSLTATPDLQRALTKQSSPAFYSVPKQLALSVFHNSSLHTYATRQVVVVETLRNVLTAAAASNQPLPSATNNDNVSEVELHSGQQQQHLKRLRKGSKQ